MNLDDKLTGGNGQGLGEATERAKTEEELHHAQKLELVGQLAGGIAHELNNLLQAIEGYTAYAMEGLLPHEQRYQDLQQVLNASSRAATITRQLLGFSRRGVLEKKHIDPNRVVADLVNTRFADDPSQDPPPVSGGAEIVLLAEGQTWPAHA
jgi:C4-dicarboxylate-specific signal transduction histidine kinase